MNLINNAQDLASRVSSGVREQIALMRQSWQEATMDNRVVNELLETITVKEAVTNLRRAGRMSMVDGINIKIYRSGFSFGHPLQTSNVYGLDPKEAIYLLGQHFFMANGYHDATIFGSGREDHHIWFSYGVLPERNILPEGKTFDVGFSYVKFPDLTLAPLNGTISLDFVVDPDNKSETKH